MGALNVDCFDIQPLTLRYYYLRKWLLESGYLDATLLNIYTVKGIVEKHYCNMENTKSDEYDSAIFWLECIDKMGSYLFYNCKFFYEVWNASYNVPYNKKFKELSYILNNKLLHFDNIDICSSTTLEENHKYDKVFLSNIIDYNRNRKDLINLLNNVKKILKEDGEIICTCLYLGKEYDMLLEQEIFSEDFYYNELYVNENSDFKEKYYRYIRKK
jgi:SAM-dependent methyltransferase